MNAHVPLHALMEDPRLERYLFPFSTGDLLCAEGDDSRDLFLLVDGALEILKGKRKIGEVRDAGAPVGEISFLLGTRRTATVRARSDGRAIRVPNEEIERFLREFPALAWRIPRVLARRLDDRTRAYHGLKEFCDQLPEAVVVADGEGRVVSWNMPAERLLGRRWKELHNRPLAEMYTDPEAFNSLIDELRSTYATQEGVFGSHHPQSGRRLLSTTLNPIFDHHHNFAGFVALQRDVTGLKKMERRYHRIRLWLVPVLLLAAVSASALVVYRPWSQRQAIVDIKQRSFENQIAKDRRLLQSLLAAPLAAGDRERIDTLLREFLAVYESAATPYRGVLLLDKQRLVVHAYRSGETAPAEDLVGSSYRSIHFESVPYSRHTVLELYRVDSENPMGRRGVEIAFETIVSGRSGGWLILQLDMPFVEQTFGVTVETLKLFRLR